MRSCHTPSSSHSSGSGSDSDSSIMSIHRGRISKLSAGRRQRREAMAKLQKMVPTAKEGDSPLVLLQHVIDYIFDLQKQLDEPCVDRENIVPKVDISDLSRMLSRCTTSSAITNGSCSQHSFNPSAKLLSSWQ
ncbi:hypothetical protein AB6A40_007684 [Gnathostoma spinigerum]|uniref:BHLH domain-containing protein n=1 Tax=Gnathostoma spinigerum TaxID=75299 RepID=A0ABD6ELY3_9BILA